MRADPTTPLRYLLGHKLTPTQRSVNRALSVARALLELDVACLKSWSIFRRSRYTQNRITSIPWSPRQRGLAEDGAGAFGEPNTPASVGRTTNPTH